jgi:signal peptidase I
LKANLKHFFLPEITKPYIFRVLFITLFLFLFFKFVCLPFRIDGLSMEPTYRDGRVNFCFKLHYMFSDLKHQDIVLIRLAGEKVFLLKRVVALEGDTVEFQKGSLIVNGEKVIEDYVQFKSNWNLTLRTVKKGHVYVVGDNRSVPIKTHQFGQTSIKRITGVPLW